MSMPTLQFEELGHIYRDGGTIVPSVTQVLDLAGLSDVSAIPLHHLERKAEIGKEVHKACHYLEEDDLDISALDPVVVPYVLAYEKFIRDTGFKAKLREERGIGEVAGMRFGYCVDRSGEMKDGGQIVIDLKTSTSVAHHWAIQTAAYCTGLGVVCDRAAIHLKKDGTYKVIPHNDVGDYDVFTAALRVAHWRLLHGAKLK